MITDYQIKNYRAKIRLQVGAFVAQLESIIFTTVWSV